MAITNIRYAIWYILERYVNLSHDFNQTTLASNITLFLVGVIILICCSRYRKSFIKLLKTNGTKVLSLNLVNELLNSFGGILSTLAGTMIPLALVSFVTQGVQPFAVIFLGVLLTRFVPRLEKEDTSKTTVIKRLLMAAVCLIGLFCIEFG